MLAVTAVTKSSLPSLQIHEVIRDIAGIDLVTFTVQGRCMEPQIGHGDRFQVLPAQWYWPGDIVVLCSYNNNYLIHRVIGAYRFHGTWKIVTQADAAPRPDAAVTPEMILGKVFVHPDHGSHVISPYLRLAALVRFVRFLAVRLVL